MKEHGRGCYRAARLWCKTGNMQQRSHGIADLVLRDGEDVVYESTYMQEIELAEALRTEAVGDGTGSHLSRPGHQLPAAKALLCVRSQFGFNTDDTHLRTLMFDRCGYTTEQSTTANRR